MLETMAGIDGIGTSSRDRSVNADPGEQPQDPFMDLPQRLANRAQLALGALMVVVFREAVGQDDGAVQRPDHFQRADFVRIARQAIPAVGSLLGKQQSRFRQLLQYFGKQRAAESDKPRRCPSRTQLTREPRPAARCRSAISP